MSKLFLYRWINQAEQRTYPSLPAWPLPCYSSFAPLPATHHTSVSVLISLRASFYCSSLTSPRRHGQFLASRLSYSLPLCFDLCSRSPFFDFSFCLISIPFQCPVPVFALALEPRRVALLSWLLQPLHNPSSCVAPKTGLRIRCLTLSTTTAFASTDSTATSCCHSHRHPNSTPYSYSDITQRIYNRKDVQGHPERQECHQGLLQRPGQSARR